MDDKGKALPSPTVSTMLRTVASIFLGMCEDDRTSPCMDEGAEEVAPAQRGMTLSELLPMLFHAEGLGTEEWEGIAAVLLSHHGRLNKVLLL